MGNQGWIRNQCTILPPHHGGAILWGDDFWGGDLPNRWGNPWKTMGRMMGNRCGGGSVRNRSKNPPGRKPKIIIFGVFGKEIDPGTMLDRSGVKKYAIWYRFHQKWLAGSRDMIVFCFGGCLGVWGGVFF